ncbi:unnamed protein product [Closterium sp. Yama58-4]|nr:unnamed protein product [Closterium sp. Yama58-4]
MVTLFRVVTPERVNCNATVRSTFQLIVSTQAGSGAVVAFWVLRSPVPQFSPTSRFGSACQRFPQRVPESRDVEQWSTNFNLDFHSPKAAKRSRLSDASNDKFSNDNEAVSDCLTELTLGLPKPSVVAAEKPSLSDLGDDLLLHIFQLAQPTAWDLCRMACVNKTWRELSYNQIFWTKLRIGPGSMRPGVEQLAARCTNLVELHIDDPRCELHVLHPIIMACGSSLRRIVIDCDRDNTSRNEASICSVLWIVSLYCSNVESVELISDGKQGNFTYLENKAMWYLTSGFRHIRSFACLCQNSLSKQAIYLMVIAWRELTCLRIHCGALGTDDLMALRKCYSLRVLELVGGNLGNLISSTSESVMHRDLEILVLTKMVCGLEDIAKASLLCPNLAKIVVRKSSLLAGGSVDNPAVQATAIEELRKWLLVQRNIELVVDEA